VMSATFYEGIEEESGSLYVQPCNCRLGTWEHPPKWITNIYRVPFEWDDEDDDEEWDEDEKHYTCSCPYCFCTNDTVAGEVCTDCLRGAHQG